MALPRAAPPNWPDVEAPPIVRLGKCQGETKRDEAALPEGVNSGETYSNRVKIMTKRTFWNAIFNFQSCSQFLKISKNVEFELLSF